MNAFIYLFISLLTCLLIENAFKILLSVTDPKNLRDGKHLFLCLFVFLHAFLKCVENKRSKFSNSL